MRVKIYQIDAERDINHVKFVSHEKMSRFQKTDKVQEGLYDRVFIGEIDVKSPEEVFVMFNLQGHFLHNGHSLSVSDVVVMDDKAFYCDYVGFKEVQFDEALVPKQENMLRMVYVEPHKPAYETEIPRTLKAMQRAVGDGLIEHFYSENGTCWVCNDESKLIGMEGNRHYGRGGVIAGPFFICGDGGEDFRSLTDAEVAHYVQKFAEPEDISQEEVEADSVVTIMSW